VSIRHSETSFTTCLGQAPARITESSGGPPVLLLHGLSACIEVQEKEAIALAHAGFTAVTIDAPHHGRRRSGLLDEMAAASPQRAHFLLLQLVTEAARELPDLIATLGAGGKKVGVVGISLGGFTALAAFEHHPRADATVSLLGSPDWTPRDGDPSEEVQRLMPKAPMHHAARFVSAPLLLANAGRDALVPAEPARRFVARLNSARARYLEYPESDHFMREQDWNALWDETIAFLKAELTPPAPLA
jgi:uncharacterized protein